MEDLIGEAGQCLLEPGALVRRHRALEAKRALHIDPIPVTAPRMNLRHRPRPRTPLRRGDTLTLQRRHRPLARHPHQQALRRRILHRRTRDHPGLRRRQHTPTHCRAHLRQLFELLGELDRAIRLTQRGAGLVRQPLLRRTRPIHPPHAALIDPPHRECFQDERVPLDLLRRAHHPPSLLPRQHPRIELARQLRECINDRLELLEQRRISHTVTMTGGCDSAPRRDYPRMPGQSALNMLSPRKW